MSEHVRSRFFANLWAILALAFILRLGWGLLIPVVPISDSKAYDILAHNLVELGTYGWSAGRPSAYWPPGTSTLYAVFYSAFGFKFAPIVALNIVLSTAVVGITALLGRRFFGDTVALIAAALMAVWPSEIGFVSIFASELPFTVLVFFAMGMWFSPRLSRWTRAIGSGLAVGIATYFRSVALLLPAVFWLTDIFYWRKFRADSPVAIIATIIIVAIIAPWTVRNYKVFDHFVPLTSSDGVNLWIGNNPEADGFYMSLPAEASGMGEYEQNEAFGKRAKDYILAHPLDFVLRTIKKAILLHARETIAVTWNAESIERRMGSQAIMPLKVLTQGYWFGVLVLALVGLMILTREHGAISMFMHPIVLTWIYFTLIYAAIVIADRYHFPSHPLISVLAALPISALARSKERKPSGQT